MSRQPSTDNARKRLIEMDMARGLATVAVILIHISACPLCDASAGKGVVTLGYVIINMAARFAVPVFVVLSGLGLSLSVKKDEGYIVFVWRRLRKIVPAYVIWSLIYSPFYNSATRAWSFGRHLSIREIGRNLLTGGACVHLYFVPLIVMLYLLFPLIRKPLGTKAGLIAAGAITMATICVYRYGDCGSPLVAYQSPLNWLFYLAMGVWLAKPEVAAALRSRMVEKFSPIALGLCIAGMAEFVYKTGKTGPDIDKAIGFSAPFIVIYTIVFVAWVWSRSWENQALVRSLKWVSKYSYGIYLSHILILAACMDFYRAADGGHFGVAFGIYTFLTVGLGVALLNAAGGYAKKLAITAVGRQA